MKKLILLLLVVGLAGGAYWFFMLRPPARSACAKVAKLCEMKPEEEKTCADEMKKLGEGTEGKKVLEDFDRCVGEAKSCAEAGGCLAGAGLNALGRSLGDFLKGFERGLKQFDPK